MKRIYFLIYYLSLVQIALANIDIDNFRKTEARYKINNVDSLTIKGNITDTSTTDGKILKYWFYSRTAYYKGDYATAFKNIKNAYKLSLQLDQELLKAEIMLDYGYILIQLNQHGDALALLLDAKLIFEKSGDKIKLANFYVTLGDFHRQLKKLNKAEEYIRKAEQFKDLPLHILSRINHRMAAVKTDWGQNDSSLFYSEKALAYAYKLNNPDLISISLNEMGCIYKEKNDFDAALTSLKTADSLWTKIGYIQYAMRARLNVANTYRKMMLFEKSNQICLENLNTCKEKKWTTLELEFCGRISSNYESLNNTELYKEYRLQEQQLFIAVLEERQRVNSEFVEAKFENEKYEAQLSVQNAQLEVEKKEKFILRILSVVAAIVILIISYLAYILRKRKRFIEIEKNKIENYASMLKLSLDEKNALLQEVNHRVKNNLQTISSIIFLQSATLKDKNIVATFEDLQRRIEAIAMVHEMLYNSDDIGKICLKKYLEKLIDVNKPIYLTNTNNLSFNIKVPQINFSINTCIALGMITNEAITNAVKHAFTSINNPVIEIFLVNKTNNEFVFQISDNGKGIIESELSNNKNTLGTRLMDIFARKIKGSLNILNKMNGTLVIVNFSENG